MISINFVGNTTPIVVWSTRNNCTSAPVGSDNGVCSSLDIQWNPMCSAIGDVAAYGRKVDLKNLIPEQSLSTSGFCLANPGSQYLVFGTSNSFTLTAVPGTYTFEWFNPSTHAIIQTGIATVGGSQTFTAPFSGQSVLWLHK